MTIEIGQPAPAFTLPADDGSVSLADYAGRKLVLYFYPKDDTSGCTMEAKDFRDQYAAVAAAGADVLGVSRDSVASHCRFKAKHALPFRLAADVDGTLCEAFGVWVEKSMYGRKYFGIERTTVLIDETGVVRRVWRKVKVKGHADEVIGALT
jgi:peroxiredoxin Q/BCP